MKILLTFLKQSKPTSQPNNRWSCDTGSMFPPDNDEWMLSSECPLRWACATRVTTWTTSSTSHLPLTQLHLHSQLLLSSSPTTTLPLECSLECPTGPLVPTCPLPISLSLCSSSCRVAHPHKWPHLTLKSPAHLGLLSLLLWHNVLMIIPLNSSLNLFIHKHLWTSGDTTVNRTPLSPIHASLVALSLFSAHAQLAPLHNGSTLTAGITGYLPSLLPPPPQDLPF